MALMKGNGAMERPTAMESLLMLMEIVMKAFTRTMLGMVKAKTGIRTTNATKGISAIAISKATVFIITIMGIGMRATGRKTCAKGLARRCMPMGLTMKDNGKRTKNMETESYIARLEKYIKPIASEN